MTWNDRTAQLEELAFLDKSECYETDYTGVYFDEETAQYALLTASGCSCWEGEYDEEQYDSLDALQAALFEGQRTYNPSLEGVKTLMTEARVKDKER